MYLPEVFVRKSEFDKLVSFPHGSPNSAQDAARRTKVKVPPQPPAADGRESTPAAILILLSLMCNGEVSNACFKSKMFGFL